MVHLIQRCQQTPIRFISFDYEKQSRDINIRLITPEVFNVLGQLQTIERVKKSGEMIYNKKEQLTNDLGAKEK